MTYKIVSASTIEKLQEFVNHNLLLGYQLQGGVCAVQRLTDATKTYGDNASTLKTDEVVYFQAMLYGT